MVLKRYWYGDGVSVLAPLKSGTRWLYDYTKPLAFSKYDSHCDLTKHYTGNEKTNYFVYRDPEEHFITAFHTEVLTYCRERILDELDLKPVIEVFKKNKAEHWSTNLWSTLSKEITQSKIKFEFINLKNLSTLFDGKFPYNKKEYDFEYNRIYLTKKELLDNLKKEYPNDWIFFNEVIKKETSTMNKVIYQSKKMNYGL
jgi:predicted lipase